MYSALKRDGEALYALARRGIEVERAPRPVRIEALALGELGAAQLEFEVTCSKGTYVRTLGEDIARALGTVGHLAALRRTSVGGAFAGASPHPLAALEALAGDEAALDALLLPIDAALEGYPAVTLGAGEVSRFRHGQSVGVASVPATQVRLYAPDGAFLGIGESDAAGCSVRPLRLMSDSASAAAATA
jgi:tRNA pseudouridine55 synthase